MLTPCCVSKAEAVLIGTPHPLHAEPAVRAAEAGVHVLVEKPMTTSAETAVDLVRRAERAGLHLAVGYTDQYAPTARLVREAVQRDIGDVVQIMAEFSSATAPLFARAEAGEQTGAQSDAADLHPATYAADQGGGQAHTQLTHVMGMVCWVTDR